MKKASILIADDNKTFNDGLKEFLSRDGNFQIAQTFDGGTTLSETDRLKPQVLILDMIMPGLDGIEVLRGLKSGSKPKVIAISSSGDDDFIAETLRYGADYVMVKPVDFTALKRRLNDVLSPEVKEVAVTGFAPRARGNRNLDEKISNVFISVGIPAHIKSYYFLRDAIKMAVDEPEIINSITKRLYPEVAEHFETTASKVERAIRHAIEVAWNKGKIENINVLFGIKVYNSNEKPTNGEFIALVADKLLLETA